MFIRCKTDDVDKKSANVENTVEFEFSSRVLGFKII